MAARSSSAMFSILVRFHVVAEGGLVGDELRVRLHHRVEDAQAVGAQRRAGLGGFDDGVGQHGRLDLGGAPGELDVHGHAEARRSSAASRAPARWRSWRPASPSADWNGESSGTASTHRTLPKLCFA
jgi:hypothetical protein